MFQTVNSLQSTVFTDKIVVVTGAAHGIGRSICKEFALKGANVIGVDILQDELAETEQIINSSRDDSNGIGSIHTFKVDLTNSQEINDMVADVIKSYKRIDVLVNNAGGVVGQIHQPIENVTDEEWERIININLTATFYLTRAVVPFMKEVNYGRIVNISSGAGRSSSLTGIQAYTSAKAGQIGFTRQMARELGPFGITVNNVAPGFVLSNPSTVKQWNNMSKASQDSLIEAISMKRLGKPEDIANAVLFFGSDYSSYISGQIISVDGGLQLF